MLAYFLPETRTTQASFEGYYAVDQLLFSAEVEELLIVEKWKKPTEVTLSFTATSDQCIRYLMRAPWDDDARNGKITYPRAHYVRVRNSLGRVLSYEIYTVNIKPIDNNQNRVTIKAFDIRKRLEYLPITTSYPGPMKVTRATTALLLEWGLWHSHYFWKNLQSDDTVSDYGLPWKHAADERGTGRLIKRSPGNVIARDELVNFSALSGITTVTGKTAMTTSEYFDLILGDDSVYYELYPEELRVGKDGMLTQDDSTVTAPFWEWYLRRASYSAPVKYFNVADGSLEIDTITMDNTFTEPIVHAQFEPGSTGPTYTDPNWNPYIYSLSAIDSSFKSRLALQHNRGYDTRLKLVDGTYNSSITTGDNKIAMTAAAQKEFYSMNHDRLQLSGAIDLTEYIGIDLYPSSSANIRLFDVVLLVDLNEITHHYHKDSGWSPKGAFTVNLEKLLNYFNI